MCSCVGVLVAQLCPTLCDSLDCSPQGSKQSPSLTRSLFQEVATTSFCFSSRLEAPLRDGSLLVKEGQLEKDGDALEPIPSMVE